MRKPAGTIGGPDKRMWREQMGLNVCCDQRSGRRHGLKLQRGPKLHDSPNKVGGPNARPDKQRTRDGVLVGCGRGAGAGRESWTRRGYAEWTKDVQ